MKHIPIRRIVNVRLTSEEYLELQRSATEGRVGIDQAVERILRAWVLEQQLLVGK